MARAHRHIWASGGPSEISTHLINRVRLLLGWALRLERAGKTTESAERFATGAAIADSVAALWGESLFHGDHDRPAAEGVPVLVAAHALATPSAEYIGNLEHLLRQSFYPSERTLVLIALSRCLESDGRRSEAVGVLSSGREDLEQEGAEPTVRLSFVREYARLRRLDGQDAGTALRQYADALEAELWALREARVATLEARREHERLSREHGAITRQAKQDPLTGLANRRELDERLETLISTPAARPLSVALVDLDGFKVVNDRCSHAEGDKVLQTVARTLRDALRVNDVVARYGGDEFVVLLPGASLLAASAALGRAADAVAGLHDDLAHGVTLSVGAVSVRPQESAHQVLSRADKAMYQAKREGGNRVAAPGLR
jgi:diguanylate cyclase (GGDEF)-like protein